MTIPFIAQFLLIIAVWFIQIDGTKIVKRAMRPPCNKQDGCQFNAEYMSQPRISPSLEVGLTNKEKIFLLHEHNRLRRRQAKGEVPNLPPASDMTEMVWDSKLASSAQSWVDRCQAVHGGHEGEGQSFAAWNDPKGALEQAVNGWFLAEYPLWSYGSPPGAAGHYTQMVTSFSTKVGCGYKNCGGGVGGLVFCHYSLPGNLDKTNPFTEGEACTKCPTHFGYCDDGLCATYEICKHRKKCKCVIDEKTCNINGKYDAAKCECECNPGWRGASCNEPCVDQDVCQDEAMCQPSHEFFLFASVNCPGMCGQCVAAPHENGPCEDTSDECKSWAEDGECDNNPEYMHQECAVSCGICDEKKKRGFMKYLKH